MKGLKMTNWKSIKNDGYPARNQKVLVYARPYMAVMEKEYERLKTILQDGTEVDVINNDKWCILNTAGDGFESPFDPAYITHWMPLPAPPIKETKK